MNALKTIRRIITRLLEKARQTYAVPFLTVLFSAGALHAQNLPLPTTQNYTCDKTNNYNLPLPGIAESLLAGIFTARRRNNNPKTFVF